MNLFKSKLHKEDVEADSFKTDLETLKVEFESVKEELKEAQESASHYQLEFVALNELMEELKAENESLKEENATLASNTATVDLKAAEIAADVVAEIGTEPVAITEDIHELSVKESLASLKGADLIAFYNANKETIFKTLKH